MRRITFLDFQYNVWNGFSFEVLGFEDKNFNQRALFSIHFGREWLIIGVLFFNVNFIK